MISVVLDTNVIASGIVRRSSEAVPVQIIDAWRAGQFELVVSQDILDEVTRTLSTPYFRARLTEDQIERALLLLTRRARQAEIDVEVHDVATHPEDDRILATALSAGADYLVTGDAGLLNIANYQGVQIQSPRDFLKVLSSEL